MTAKLFGPELKPWEGSSDERLSPSSYGATALFGIAEMAVEHLHDQGEEVTGNAVGAWAKVFARILVKAQMEVGETGGWDAALNTRLRGALHTALRVVPFDPTDQDTLADSIDDFEERLYDLVINIAKTAAWLHKHGAAGILG